MPSDTPIPVIDLFAGPGGLGEGFSALGQDEGRRRFKIHLSIEKDPQAHQTLELRAFYRQFPHGRAPEKYYQHLRRELSRQELFNAYPDESRAARDEAWCQELGSQNADAIRKRVKKALAGADPWLLIGGPPLPGLLTRRKVKEQRRSIRM